MTRKGVYPYDYMSSFDKFSDTNLPSKEQFYSILNDEHITDEDYKHAQTVSKEFKIKKTLDNTTIYIFVYYIIIGWQPKKVVKFYERGSEPP